MDCITPAEKQRGTRRPPLVISGSTAGGVSYAGCVSMQEVCIYRRGLQSIGVNLLERDSIRPGDDVLDVLDLACRTDWTSCYE